MEEVRGQRAEFSFAVMGEEEENVAELWHREYLLGRAALSSGSCKCGT